MAWSGSQFCGYYWTSTDVYCLLILPVAEGTLAGTTHLSRFLIAFAVLECLRHWSSEVIFGYFWRVGAFRPTFWKCSVEDGYWRWMTSPPLICVARSRRSYFCFEWWGRDQGRDGLPCNTESCFTSVADRVIWRMYIHANWRKLMCIYYMIYMCILYTDTCIYYMLQCWICVCMHGTLTILSIASNAGSWTWWQRLKLRWWRHRIALRQGTGRLRGACPAGKSPWTEKACTKRYEISKRIPKV